MNTIRKRSGAAINLLIVFIVIALMLMTSCKKKSTPPVVDGTLFGFVTDSLSSAPIESAGIYTYDLTSAPRYTDSLGHYALQLAPNSGINIYCQKSGYDTRLSQCSITASESTRVDFHLVHLVR